MKMLYFFIFIISISSITSCMQLPGKNIVLKKFIKQWIPLIRKYSTESSSAQHKIKELETKKHITATTIAVEEEKKDLISPHFVGWFIGQCAAGIMSGGVALAGIFGGLVFANFCNGGFKKERR